MLILRDPASIADITDTALRALIEQRVQSLSEFDDYALGDLATFIVVEPEDTVSDIDAQLCFPILGTPFELMEEHPGYYELVYVVRDDGFGIEVFIPRIPGIAPELLALCTTQEKSD